MNTNERIQHFEIFDSHFHIIDPAFPIIENQGFIPAPFTALDYLGAVKPFPMRGGVVVSGSFQGFDQTYLSSALRKLGPEYVGVTQLPYDTPDDEIKRLSSIGVRGIRFNIKRSIGMEIEKMEILAQRAYKIGGLHVELYIDAKDLKPFIPFIQKRPKISIDHLGLSKAGFSTILELVKSENFYVKASGFSRTDLDVVDALQKIIAINPSALMFGSDLPGTRAPRPFGIQDIEMVLRACESEDILKKIFSLNAKALYRI